MNKLILVAETGEVFGPFDAVERGADRWLADGQHLPFAVVGEDATPSEQGAWVPPAPPPPVPTPVSPRQIRQALTRASLRDAVEAAVAAGDQDLRDWWEFATSIERNHPQVVAMGAALGADLDQLFILAGSL